jgi:nucleoside-diphosphate-sugar epimerase
MANVLIMGCGYIGTHLGMLLARNGHSVWGAKRKVESLPPEIHPVTVDVMHLTDADLPEALDYIFYMVSPDAYSDEAYRTAYEHGVRNLLFALQKAHQKPTRIIMVSSTGVYGQQTGEWVDETSPTEPMDFAGFRVLMGEETFLDSIFTVSVVRLGGIYGPGRENLIQRVRTGEAKCSTLSPYTNRIHLADAVGVLSHVMNLQEPDNIYLGVDSHACSRNDVIQWLAKQLGVKVEWSDEPDRITHRPMSNKKCKNTRIVMAGYDFIYPSFKEGYGALIRSRLPKQIERESHEEIILA